MKTKEKIWNPPTDVLSLISKQDTWLLDHKIFFQTQKKFIDLPSVCWCGFIGNSCRHISSLGKICFLRNTSIWPSRNTPCHGFKITLAELSDGCQLSKALPSLCLIGAYRGSSFSPGKMSEWFKLSKLCANSFLKTCNSLVHRILPMIQKSWT